jgi:5-methylcytosine-specific restriction endonuclease McrA
MVAKRALRSGEFLGHPAQPLGNCPLCARPLVAGPSVDEHHLLPKSQGGRETFTVHRICHRKIHATLGEKELARSFASWPALQAHPEIASFITWVQKKAPEYYDNSIKPAHRR